MRGEFIEDMHSDKVDPTTKDCEEFDWDDLYERLGELDRTRAAETEEQHEQQMQRLAFALGTILDWIINGQSNRRPKQFLRAVGMRTVAMAWVIDPKRFDDASIRQLSKALGFTAANISPLTAEFSRLYSVFNKFQNHDWRKEK